MRRTTLGLRQVGDRVNLERALKASARLGGHIVQGHVDGVGTIMSTRSEGEGWWVTVEPPFELMKYIVEKGSICVRRRVADCRQCGLPALQMALIPAHARCHQRQQLARRHARQLEVDIVAKYVERFNAVDGPTSRRLSGYRDLI
jgi:riboflavin synthase